MIKGNILIVHDDNTITESLQAFAKEFFSEVKSLKNPIEIPALVYGNKFDAIVLSTSYNTGIITGNEGLFWSKEIRKIDNDVAIVVLAREGKIEEVELAISGDIDSYILQPWTTDVLLTVLNSAICLRRTRKECRIFRSEITRLKDNAHKINEEAVYKSVSMQDSFKMARIHGRGKSNILIFSDDGIESELIAREIHNESERAGNIFTSFDFSTITESEIERTIFGYSSNAFSDLHSTKPGLFETASGGTLFLHRIDLIPPYIQHNLSKALSSGQISRLGSDEINNIDVRLIASIKAEADSKSERVIRNDLRIAFDSKQIEFPSLMDRPDDISTLCTYYLSLFGNIHSKPHASLSKSAQSKLKRYSFPGKRLELRRIIEKAVVLSDTGKISPDDIHTGSVPKKMKSVLLNIEANEKKLIGNALSKSGNNLTETSLMLGISRKTLYNKIKRYSL